MVKGTSIKQGLLLTVILVTGLAVALSSTINLLIQSRNYEASLIERAEANIEILTVTVAQALSENNSALADNILSGLQQTNFITHAHLYRYVSTTDRIDFFTSYNRSDLPPLPNRANNIEDYTQATTASGSIEIARPIYNPDHQLLGYMYIRASLSELNNYIWKASTYAFASFALSLLIAGILSNVLRRYLMRPLIEVNEVARQINQTRNYDLRLPPAELLEIDHFSASMNKVLDKLQLLMRKARESDLEHHNVVEDLESKIQQRTSALRTANQELVDTLEQLHSTQNKRLETERLAAMSNMVAGIAHEINTPVGLSVTAASLIEDKLEELQGQLEEGNKEKLNAIYAEFVNNINIVQRNLKRAGELIGSFRSLAFEHAKEEPSVIYLEQFGNIMVDRLSPLLKNPEKCKIELSTDDSIIKIRRHPLEGILTELLENAIYHGFKNKDHGIIDLRLHVKEGKLLIQCHDNGVGMSEEIQKRIFEPFMTSSRSSGHPGLGMHLVYNLVTQLLKGKISCTSVADQGTKFDIEIPVQVEE
ncbi:HAMP domain-containing sensor histidine kinase [Lysobacter sp. N42]|uniref:sensor histidine kinase n=2 Tax=Gammaproteobacteria TaxID=1236 RepID=UPI00140513DD|nr:HAMP domain-containing sensor histidine kinase [Lysobacter sp. N42]